jgi:hypothetical protein
MSTIKFCNVHFVPISFNVDLKKNAYIHASMKSTFNSQIKVPPQVQNKKKEKGKDVIGDEKKKVGAVFFIFFCSHRATKKRFPVKPV